jgi:hypothetical protein
LPFLHHEGNGSSGPARPGRPFAAGAMIPIVNQSGAAFWFMKRLAILFIAGLAVLSTSCINRGAKTKASKSSDDATAIIDGKDAAANTTQVQDTMTLGKLCFVNLKEGEQPVMTALSLAGNRSGSSEYNSKPCATDGIRAVFELNEWVEFYPEATAESGIKVMVFRHQADPGFDLAKALNDETPGDIQECELKKDPDADETSQWGSFYLHTDEVAPGFYDFVFLYKDKVFATMLTQFFKEPALEEKSDSELDELMQKKA